MLEEDGRSERKEGRDIGGAKEGGVTINVPVVYMGRYEVVLRGFEWFRVMDSPPSKPLRTAPYKQQVHWLFYVPAYAYAYVCIMQYAL